MTNGNDQIPTFIVTFEGTQKQLMMSAPGDQSARFNCEIETQVEGQQLRFPCKFSRQEDSGSYLIKVYCNDESHLGKKFGVLLELNEERVSEMVRHFLENN